MPEHLIVGIEHGSYVNDSFLSERCAARFVAEVRPLITDRTLLLIEGFASEQLVTSTSKLRDGLNRRIYDVLIDQDANWLGSVRPTFGGYDNRMKTAVQKERRYSDIERWVTVSHQIFESDLPTGDLSWEDILALLREGPCEARLARAPTSEERQLASWVWSAGRKFDRAYIAAMRKYASRFEKVIFVGGAVHALSSSRSKQGIHQRVSSQTAS
jgi:hypothetical protein